VGGCAVTLAEVAVESVAGVFGVHAANARPHTCGGIDNRKPAKKQTKTAYHEPCLQPPTQTGTIFTP
jgi:hypothetical protein